MSDSGYPVSVIDLSCNQVEIYSTRGGPVVTECVPEYRFGSQGESVLIESALA
jgi:hypothetical protein